MHLYTSPTRQGMLLLLMLLAAVCVVHAAVPINTFKSDNFDLQQITERSPPSPRADHTVTAVAGRIYVFGGSATAGQLVNDIHFFDALTDRWSGALIRDWCCLVGDSVDEVGQPSMVSLPASLPK
jgi:Galactose oxidase, central domain